MEIWKQLKSPYDKYEVSNRGRIRNTKTNYHFITRLNDNGYHRVSLSYKNKSKSYLAHRLVAEYFIENFNANLVINHIDGNRLNNDVSNLECVTIKENSNKKVFENYGRKKRCIFQYDKNNNLIKKWHRVKDITNVSKKGIHDALNHGRLYKGYYWKYKNLKIDGEIWKDLNFKDVSTCVSSHGRIKLKSGKISYGSKNESGYFGVSINNKWFRVHRLICMAFKPIDNYEDLVVNHIDGNRGNNNTDNLEWVTQSYNSKHSYKEKRNIFRRTVIRIDRNKNFVEYESLEMASKSNNIKNKGNIVLVCQNKRKSAGGFFWKYKE